MHRAQVIVPPRTTVHTRLCGFGRAGARNLLMLLRREEGMEIAVLPTTSIERGSRAPLALVPGKR